MNSRSKRGGIFGTLLLALLALLLAVFLAGNFIARNVTVRSQETAHGRSTRIETPMGSANVTERGAFSPESVGIPVYPGAVKSEHGPTFAVESSSGDRFSYVMAEYLTPDSIEDVRNYYRRQNPHWIFSNEDGKDSRAEYSHDGYKRIIVLSRQNGRTHIALASTGEPAAN